MSSIHFFAIAGIVAFCSAVGMADDQGTAKNSPVELTATLDRETAQIAEPFMLTLTAKAPDGVIVSFSQQPEKLGALNVVNVTEAFDIPTLHGRQWVRRYQLESFAAGQQTIPPIPVAFTDRRSSTPTTGAVQSSALDVTVTSVLEGKPDPLKFRDLKDVVELPVVTQPSHAWIAWSLGSAAVLLLAGLALWVWPQHGGQLSPKRWALNQLEQLEQSDLMSAGPMDAFYSRLTSIVRQYIEKEFAIAAPNLTTAEFLDQATRHETLIPSQRELLRVFLTQADLVKFARLEPAAYDACNAITTARQFIEQTPVEETV